MVRVFVVVGQMYQTWRRPRAHHLRACPSRTLLGNEQKAGFLRWRARVKLWPRTLDIGGCLPGSESTAAARRLVYFPCSSAAAGPNVGKNIVAAADFS